MQDLEKFTFLPKAIQHLFANKELEKTVQGLQAIRVQKFYIHYLLHTLQEY